MWLGSVQRHLNYLLLWRAGEEREGCRRNRCPSRTRPQISANPVEIRCNNSISGRISCGRGQSAYKCAEEGEIVQVTHRILFASLLPKPGRLMWDSPWKIDFSYVQGNEKKKFSSKWSCWEFWGERRWNSYVVLLLWAQNFDFRLLKLSRNHFATVSNNFLQKCSSILNRISKKICLKI